MGWKHSPTGIQAIKGQSGQTPLQRQIGGVNKQPQVTLTAKTKCTLSSSNKYDGPTYSRTKIYAVHVVRWQHLLTDTCCPTRPQQQIHWTPTAVYQGHRQIDGHDWFMMLTIYYANRVIIN